MLIPLEPFIYLMIAVQVFCGVFLAAAVALGLTLSARLMKRKQKKIKNPRLGYPRLNPAAR